MFDTTDGSGWGGGGSARFGSVSSGISFVNMSNVRMKTVIISIKSMSNISKQILPQLSHDLFYYIFIRIWPNRQK